MSVAIAGWLQGGSGPYFSFLIAQLKYVPLLIFVLKKRTTKPFHHISFHSLSGRDFDEKNSNTSRDIVRMPENNSDYSPSGTLTMRCKIEPEDRDIPENGPSLSKPLPTRYMMEIDDCLPERCVNVDCPLWKPLSKRHFCWLKFRCRVRVFVEKKYFEWFILATVFMSSFTLVCSVC